MDSRNKAQSLLLSLVARDPCDKQVRQRLLSLYKGENKYSEAAEQCLLLAALYRRIRNEEAAQKYLDEANQLSPETVKHEKDLDAFARRNGIEVESAPAQSSAVDQHAPQQEVDLSSDLLDIFFSGDQELIEEEKNVLQPEEGHDLSHPPSKNIQEQLQEVDFYIRLGFHDEAETKLNEIAKISPEDPELISRYQKLGEIKQPPSPKTAPAEVSGKPLFGEPIQPASPDDMEIIRVLEPKDAQDGFVESKPEQLKKRSDEQATPVDVQARTTGGAQQPAMHAASQDGHAKEDFKGNEMFADLMEEVAVLSDHEISQESFEDHFGLGTAYRDMDLSEEAIAEFEFAWKIADLKRDSRRMIQCCGMLSTCYLKKRMPNSALRWCQTGLNTADISFHEAMALRYDMGVAHSMSGSNGLALECFDRVFGQDPSYRDVAQRIDELRACR